MRQDFYYLSQDKKTNIHAMEWLPEGEPRAVLQICHGMVEYIKRYDNFARYLTKKGYYVVGHDHLGHGESVQMEEDYGFFDKKAGNACVIGDIHSLFRRTKEKYPHCPYFLLGHSMGSFLVRQYIQTYSKGLTGAVIMGTGHQPFALLQAGKFLCRIIARLKGDHYRSALINGMALGSYNRSFQPARTLVDWISKDEAVVDEYVKDPWCTFVFTVNGYYGLFTGMQTLSRENINCIPKDFPLFFISGEQDAVGNFGKGVEKVFENYRQCGLKNVSLKLYKDDRHEILNETDRDVVYKDLYEWMETHLDQ